MYKTLLYILLFSFVGSCLLADDKDEILDNKNELNKIENKIEQSEKKLKDLEKQGVAVQKKLAESNQKINIDKKVIRQLNNELSQIQNQISNTEDELNSRTEQLERNKFRYLGNIRQFYFSAHRSDNILSEDPNEELRLNRQIRYLSSFASFESENVEFAQELLEETEEKKVNLVGESKSVSKLKKKKETSKFLAEEKKKKQERELIKVKREEEYESDKISRLTAEAEEMQTLIERLIEDQIQQTTKESFFAALKGQIRPPYRGKIVESYGDKVDPVTYLRSFIPGITIKGTPGGKVSAVASGTIAYVGDLRGYGNFIIINHDDRFFTTYAGLSDILVTKGQYVLAGYKIGTSGTDGLVKFEIRDGKNTVDPIFWIQFDSFR